MKKKTFFFAVIIFAALAFSFTIMPKRNNGSDIKAGLEAAYPCPCSRFKCCNKPLVFYYRAYQVDLGPCRYCGGRGWNEDKTLGRTQCGTCKGTGRNLEWRSGCVCENCGSVYERPDNCN